MKTFTTPAVWMAGIVLMLATLGLLPFFGTNAGLHMSTASGLILLLLSCALALFIQSTIKKPSGAVYAGLGAFCMMVALGLSFCFLVEALIEVDWRWIELLIRENADYFIYPLASLCAFLSALSMIPLFQKPVQNEWTILAGNILALTVIHFCLFAIAGHLIDLPALYDFRLSMGTAVAYFLLASAVLWISIPFKGLLNPLFSASLTIRGLCWFALLLAQAVMMDGVNDIIHIQQQYVGPQASEDFRHSILGNEISTLVLAVLFISLFLRALYFWEQGVYHAQRQTRVESDLQETEKMFLNTFEQAAVGIAHVSQTGRWLRLNRKYYELLGYDSSDPLLELGYVDVTHPDDINEDVALRQKLLSRDIEQYSLEKRYIRKDGTPVWVNLTASAVWKDTGQLDYFVAVAECIQARKEAEAALRESEHKFRRVIRSNLIGIFFWEGLEGTIVDANDVFLDIVGYAREDLALGHVNWRQMTPPGYELIEGRAIRELEQRGHITPYEKQFIRKNGTLVDVLLGGAVMEDSPNQGVAFIIDISKRKKDEKMLQVLTEELEQRVQTRTAQLQATNNELESFAYSVSHDLRAPLRSIDGFSRLTLSEHGDTLNDEARRYLTYIRENAQSMGELIDDLLQLSRVTRADFNKTQVDLGAICQKFIETQKLEAPHRDCNITIEENLLACGDPILLRAMLNNLLENAWKFSAKKPQVHIHVGYSTQENAFFVSDQGAGFHPEHTEKLFGAFQRLHSEEEFPGTGIGLATVQRIIQRHGGRVWATGKPNEGASFFFVLPST